MNKLFIFSILVSLVFFTACSTRGARTYSQNGSQAEKTYSDDKNDHNSKMDRKTYTHPTMRPYEVRGIKYCPTVVSVGDEFSGNASWYGPTFHGKLTSNGEVYNMHDMTAAHKTLPMNTIVKVTNSSNGLSTVVRINDRGPFIATRIIDLSKTAASKIKMLAPGTAPVTIEILGFETKGKKNIPSIQELQDSPRESYDGSFALQIASFSKIEGALKTQETYDNTDSYKTIIKDMENGKGRIFKVWLTGFKSEEEARDYMAQGNFKNSFIVRKD
ncbi:septal ring lytic transglycosylase RlpA family protein [bacterium]|nr:septal ring lytic transglycosylase RlpA family protein [bacterium]MBU1995465.1 septal ring lytic transglycosylase RlpA family protein [bacterium]